MLPERTGISKHVIKLEEDKQSPYWQIYSLDPMELKILKTYLKTNLANRFIQPSKFPAGALILFIRKPDASLHLCINY